MNNDLISREELVKNLLDRRATKKRWQTAVWKARSLWLRSTKPNPIRSTYRSQGKTELVELGTTEAMTDSFKRRGLCAENGGTNADS